MIVARLDKAVDAAGHKAADSPGDLSSDCLVSETSNPSWWERIVRVLRRALCSIVCAQSNGVHQGKLVRVQDGSLVNLALVARVLEQPIGDGRFIFTLLDSHERIRGMCRGTRAQLETRCADVETVTPPPGLSAMVRIGNTCEFGRVPIVLLRIRGPYREAVRADGQIASGPIEFPDGSLADGARHFANVSEYVIDLQQRESLRQAITPSEQIH